MRGRKLVAAAALVAMAISGPSSAIVADPLPRVCNELARADYVFVGTVLGAGRLPETGATELTQFYRIRMGEVFKGRMDSEVTVYTLNNSARAVLDVGRRSVIFSRLREGKAAFFGSSNSRSDPGVDQVVAAIRAARARSSPNASISGRADLDGSPGHPATGIRLAVVGASGPYHARTDAAGQFSVEVKPGHYSVRVVEPGRTGRRGAYSYDDPAALDLGRGDCVDVQLEILSQRR